jgi:hypothetical protein
MKTHRIKKKRVQRVKKNHSNPTKTHTLLFIRNLFFCLPAAYWKTWRRRTEPTVFQQVAQDEKILKIATNYRINGRWSNPLWFRAGSDGLVRHVQTQRHSGTARLLWQAQVRWDHRRRATPTYAHQRLGILPLQLQGVRLSSRSYILYCTLTFFSRHI